MFKGNFRPFDELKVNGSFRLRRMFVLSLAKAALPHPLNGCEILCAGPTRTNVVLFLCVRSSSGLPLCTPANGRQQNSHRRPEFKRWTSRVGAKIVISGLNRLKMKNGYLYITKYPKFTLKTHSKNKFHQKSPPFI